MSNGGNPGWRDDPQRPGLQRYWVGGGWADDIAARPAPDPIWRSATATALGVLIALAAVSVLQAIF